MHTFNKYLSIVISFTIAVWASNLAIGAWAAGEVVLTLITLVIVIQFIIIIVSDITRKF